jgi:hypothetical protein
MRRLLERHVRHFAASEQANDQVGGARA